jgi:ABC-2 type transport system permease protein
MTGTVVLAGMRLHFGLIARRPLKAVALLTTPLLTVIFSSIGRHSGREDFLVSAVVGAGLIGVWVLAVNEVGDLISAERWWGTLQLLLAAPAPLPVIVLGRLVSVVAIGSLAFVESYLVGMAVFGAALRIHHPTTFVLGLAATFVAILGTGSLLTPLFVLTRVAVMFEILLMYPFYILGAVVFPVRLLPGWAQPLSELVFLRWSSELLRDAAGPAPPAHAGPRILVILAFGVCSYLLGQRLMSRVVGAVRGRGTADQA